MNNILAQLSSAPMYAICGGIIAFVAAVCVVFLVRSYRAGLAIGMDLSLIHISEPTRRS